MPYRQLDHTADLAVEVTAPDLDGLFAEALRAMTDCVTDLASVRRTTRRRVALSAPSPELLLIDWLSEALYLFETEGLVAAAARVEISDLGADGARLEGELAGEPHDPSRHPHRVAIKAVTYHGLALAREADGWRARVIFDI